MKILSSENTRINSGAIIKSVLVLFIVISFFMLAWSPRTHLYLGDIFFGKYERTYDVDTAQYFYTNAAYPFVGNPAAFAHYQLSRTYFIQGDLEQALLEAELELEKYPNNARTYYILGLTHGYLDNEEEGIEAFEKFIEAYPVSWAARNDMAWLQFRIGDINGALETMEPVAFINNPWVQNTYGSLLMNSGDYVDAAKAFAKASDAIQEMTPAEWGQAYPGNHPAIYEVGISAMKRSIQENQALLYEKMLSPSDFTN